LDGNELLPKTGVDTIASHVREYIKANIDPHADQAEEEAGILPDWIRAGRVFQDLPQRHLPWNIPFESRGIS
jgi:hypothetical protein